MAFQDYAEDSSDIVLSAWWGGRDRSLRLPSWLGFTLAIGLALAVCWTLGATAFVVFHDKLVAAMVARQTDMQYAYEDRIFALRTQLDRATSQNLADRQAIETTIRDLGERGARLEARAATIDTLVADGIGRPGVRALGAGATIQQQTSVQSIAPHDAPPSDGPKGETAAPGLRLDGAFDSGLSSAEDQPSTTDDRTAGLASNFDAVEARQNQVVARLRDPALRAVARMREALRRTGLALGTGAARPDVGGPFVPLDVGAADFGQSVNLLHDVVAEFTRLSDIVDRVPLRQPLHGRLEVSSTFGARLDPFYGRPAMHTGIDLRESYGDGVEATAAGIVTIAGPDGGYGNMVEIDHGNGLSTRYAHLSSVDVAVHQHVKAGDLVGRVGSSGRATGPHLHYETRIRGEAVDPARFLKAGAGLFPG